MSVTRSYVLLRLRGLDGRVPDNAGGRGRGSLQPAGGDVYLASRAGHEAIVRHDSSGFVRQHVEIVRREEMVQEDGGLAQGELLAGAYPPTSKTKGGVAGRRVGLEAAVGEASGVELVDIWAPESGILVLDAKGRDDGGVRRNDVSENSRRGRTGSGSPRGHHGEAQRFVEDIGHERLDRKPVVLVLVDLGLQAQEVLFRACKEIVEGPEHHVSSRVRPAHKHGDQVADTIVIPACKVVRHCDHGKEGLLLGAKISSLLPRAELLQQVARRGMHPRKAVAEPQLLRRAGREHVPGERGLEMIPNNSVRSQELGQQTLVQRLEERVDDRVQRERHGELVQIHGRLALALIEGPGWPERRLHGLFE
eukprot:m.261741 g.261741  ORF g.261741 m.261741 type:complete len:364 (+) comp24856_c0_seq1:155-1246(+)